MAWRGMGTLPARNFAKGGASRRRPSTKTEADDYVRLSPQALTGRLLPVNEREKNEFVGGRMCTALRNGGVVCVDGGELKSVMAMVR